MGGSSITGPAGNLKKNFTKIREVPSSLKPQYKALLSIFEGGVLAEREESTDRSRIKIMIDSEANLVGYKKRSFANEFKSYANEKNA